MKKWHILIVSFSIFLTGCLNQYSTLGDNIYKKTPPAKPLIVPKDLSNKKVNHFYQLPDES